MIAKRILVLLSIVLLNTTSAFAQSEGPNDISVKEPKGVTSLKSLKAIAILEHGRIKPLDTYARNMLLQLSGRRTFEKRPAIEWLAKLIFAPESTKHDKVFLINNHDIPAALNINKEKKRRYSFSQLQPHYLRIEQLALTSQKIEEKKRDLVETELIRVYQNLKLYSTLSLSFAFAAPHHDFAVSNHNNRRQLNLPEGTSSLSFLDIALRADRLQKLIQKLESKRPENWTEAEKELMNVTNALFQWTLLYRNLLLEIIPSYNQTDKTWYSPWDASTIALTSEEGRNELLGLQKAFDSYWTGKQIDFDLAIKSFSNSIDQRLARHNWTNASHVHLEVIYNKLNLLTLSKTFFFLTFLIALIGLSMSNVIIYRMGIIFLTLGFLPLLVALILRIIILERPPVSNLYETFIFVGFMSAIVGIIVERIHKQWLGIVISSMAGFIFLAIANKFSAEGDTLQMLVAVLNSNFWLGTHVLTITTGYAGVCVAGIVGHVYLLQAIFKANNKDLLSSTYKILMGTLGFGLTMTFLGTNLGGVWADQSWGRFWGWDPKENGALMIILWCAILFHAKVGRMIGPLGLAVGSALGGIVVMWAWFGVNLLSVGLHSYGFTSGLATNLSIYFICQVLFILVTYPIAKNKLVKS